MIKSDEMNKPDSCWSRARPDEMVFTLLGRDDAAPAAIRAWIEKRIALGKNLRGDLQLLEAESVAVHMEKIDGKAAPWASVKFLTRDVGVCMGSGDGSCGGTISPGFVFCPRCGCRLNMKTEVATTEGAMRTANPVVKQRDRNAAPRGM